jgi:hypothetical protein
MRQILIETIEQKIKEDREYDKQFIIKHGDLVPHLNCFRFCVCCNKVIKCIGLFPKATIEEIREIFEDVVLHMLRSELRCSNCGVLTLPLGYAWSATGWMLSGDPEFEKELQRYLEVLGTIRHHPKRVEVFLTSVMTMIGVNKMFTSTIKRKNKRIKFKPHEVYEGPPEVEMGGIFQVKLPQYSENFYVGLRDKIRECEELKRGDK